MSIINIAREVSCQVWETSVIHLLWCDKRQEKKWADLYLDDETNIEVKCRLYGQPVNVLVEQLLELRDSDLYALVFYKMSNWHRPVKTLKLGSKNMKKAIAYLRNMMQVSEIYLFPQVQMIDFYNNSKVNERTISSSWLKHKWLSVTRAFEMYQNTTTPKAIFDTPIEAEQSFDAITHVIWEKIIEKMISRWYKAK